MWQRRISMEEALRIHVCPLRSTSYHPLAHNVGSMFRTPMAANIGDLLICALADAAAPTSQHDALGAVG
jgi:hypothetical protein